MKFSLWSYRLGLREPLAALGETRRYRAGLLLGKRLDSGEWRFGEAAPIPSFHRITLTETGNQIRQQLSGCTEDTHPIVQWCFQQLSIETTPEQVLVNQLLQPSSATAQPQSSIVKLKVGRQSVEEDQQWISALLSKHPELTLRLDANRLWSPSQAQQFWEWAQKLPIEYIEDPVANPADLDRLSTVPVALDELLEPSLITHPNVRAVVIKPSLCGDMTNALIEIARKNQRKVVLSSAFETSVGLSRIAALADKAVAHGLGTIDWFEQHLVKQPATIVDGSLRFPWTRLSLEHIHFDRLNLEHQQ